MIKIKCARCKHELGTQGALAFGPPYDGLCSKWHICKDCWYKYVICVIKGDKILGR
jgi:hypothetical protein